MNWERGEYWLTDDATRLDLDAICALLSTTYWAADRAREATETAMRHSVCFGLFHDGKQIGFARAVTDRTVFSYLGDVVIAPEHRGQGLGKWMVETILAHPDLQTNTQCLRTRDAHTLYERFGFAPTEFLRRSRLDWSKDTSQ